MKPAELAAPLLNGESRIIWCDSRYSLEEVQLMHELHRQTNCPDPLWVVLGLTCTVCYDRNRCTAWYQDGLTHRNDGPAIVSYTAKMKRSYWYQFGQIHRDDGGPAIVFRGDGVLGGHKEWWQRDMRHREDGPAVVATDGRKEWWLRGKRHRAVEDGPAIIDPSGDEEYWETGRWLHARKER